MRNVCLLSALILASAATCPAQSSATGPSFEAASLKLAAPSAIPNASQKGGPGTQSPTLWTCTSMPLRQILSEAWDLDGSPHLSSTSDLDAPRYDITAKVAPEASRADFRLMLRRLLIERLGLQLHIASKELNVQELTVAASGLKMTPAETAPPDAPAPSFRGVTTDKNGNLQLPAGYPMVVTLPTPDGGIAILGRVQGVDSLIKQLMWPIGQTIVDRTGLSGKYDFTLKCSREDITASLGSTPEGATPKPDPVARAACVRSALADQLGLRLQPAKATVGVLVVDSFSRVPSEN